MVALDGARLLEQRPETFEGTSLGLRTQTQWLRP
jgi:hypothetical protein